MMKPHHLTALLIPRLHHLRTDNNQTCGATTDPVSINITVKHGHVSYQHIQLSQYICTATLILNAHNKVNSFVKHIT